MRSRRRVVNLPRRIKANGQRSLVRRRGAQRQLQDEARRALSGHWSYFRDGALVHGKKATIKAGSMEIRKGRRVVYALL
jgi:hypothetical protein